MRRLVLFAALLVGVGCYSPTYLQGLKCSDKNTCPPGQGCNPEGICMPTAAFDAGNVGGAGGRSLSGAAGTPGAGGAAGAAGRGGAAGSGGAAGTAGRGGAAGTGGVAGGAGAGGTSGAGGVGNRGGTTDGGTTDGGTTDGRPAVDAGPRCGDGHLDPGEECDDRNAASGDGCSATCQIEGLVGHWALGTQYMSGDAVPDLVTPGHAGTIVNVNDEMDLVADHFGRPASAISIEQADAVSDDYAYVRVPGLTSLTPPLTMTIWINQQSGDGMGLVMGIDQGPQVYEEGYALTMRVPSSPGNYSGVSDVPLTKGQWVFVAAVFTQSGSSWQLTLYTNDSPSAGTPAIASVPEKEQFNIGGLYQKNDSCATNEQVCNSGFVGYLNDARIYGRALSAQEIQNLYAFVLKP
jgi:cysteine-rich repeat protein